MINIEEALQPTIITGTFDTVEINAASGRRIKRLFYGTAALATIAGGVELGIGEIGPGVLSEAYAASFLYLAGKIASISNREPS